MDKQQKPFFNTRMLKICLFLFVFALFLLAFITLSSVTIMFIGLLPSLFAVLFLCIGSFHSQEAKAGAFLSPLLFALIFFFSTNHLERYPFSIMDISAFTLVNTLLPYSIYIIYLFFFTLKKPKHISPKKKSKKLEHIVKEAKNLPSPEKLAEEKKEEKPAKEQHGLTLPDVPKHTLPDDEEGYETLNDKIQAPFSSKEADLEEQRYQDIAKELSHEVHKQQEIAEHYKQLVDQYRTIASQEKDKKHHEQQLRISYRKKIEDHVKILEQQRNELERNYMLQKKDHTNKRIKALYKQKVKLLEDQLTSAHEALHVTRENLKHNMRNIEDKCKAINFAIGRVYSNKNGASKEIRDKLKIERVLYNAFSKLYHSRISMRKARLLVQVLDLLYKKLSLLESRERLLFTLPAKTPLLRHPYGDDSIIDVLSANDSDPVHEYYIEVMEVCINLLSFLKKEYDL